MSPGCPPAQVRLDLLITRTGHGGEVDLSGANLTDANLTQANLTAGDTVWYWGKGGDVDLSNADLNNANLEQASLTAGYGRHGGVGAILGIPPPPPSPPAASPQLHPDVTHMR